MTARIKVWLGLLAACLVSLSDVSAEPIKTLDLKQWVTPSPFDNISGSWLLPRDRQIIDGVPFQIDGIVLMYGNYSAQKGRLSRTNMNGIAVGSAFNCLHLLVTTQAKAPDGTALTRIAFLYEDGSSNSVEVAYGVHVRNWFGPWHSADTPLADSSSREVWRALFSAAATSDNYIRMFHVVFTNPSPAKVVRSLSLESLKKTSGVMIAGMSVGPRFGESLTDTIAQLKSPFPDLRPRSGEVARGEGVIRTLEGQAIAGARVRVAGVRQFSEGYNNSRTDDPTVGTEAVTGTDGRFILPPLPDNLMYKLVVFADGYEPSPQGGLDVKSDPLEVRLKPLPPPGKYAIHARVVDKDGHPIAGAIVEPEGVSDGRGGTSWGGSHGFPEQLISGTNGEFIISRKDEFTRLQLNVTAPDLAPAKLWLPPSNTVQVIELGSGVLLRGRVVKDGKPLAGLQIGVSGADRNSEVYAGHYETRTDGDGVFTFKHLPPNIMWYLYGIMSSVKQYGTISPKPVQTAAHGQTNDLGDVEVTKGLRLAGQVVTRNGEPLPKGLKVRVGHELAWDSQTATVDASGNFELQGVHKGQLNLSTEPREWRLASVNRSIDMWNGWRMTGLLQQDKDDMLIVIEKGEFNYNSYSGANGQLPNADWPQNRSLSGAEPSGPFPIILAGQVLDDKSGQPLAGFRVLPGYKPPVSSAPPPAKPLIKSLVEPFTKKTIPWNEQPYWKFSQTETFSNGTFAVAFVPLTSTPMLRIEADGYQSFETTPTNMTTSNVVVRLKTGVGPNGVVLLPDGKPAEGAAVFYAVNKEGFALEGRKLRSYDRNNGSVTTSKDGKFSFPARAHGEMIYVSHPSGWVQESVESGGENLKLRLQPWGVVIGTLVSTNGQPMSGVELEINMPNDWQRGDPRVYMPMRATTDAQGKFQFVDVPPVRLDVNRIVRMTANSWSTHPQTWFVAQPGTNDLGKVTYDRPPPPTMLEQLKKSIGL